MAVTMQLENIETALVYEYLLAKDTSLAKVFGSKFKVQTLSKGSPKLRDVLSKYPNVNKIQVNATNSSDDSSDDSSEEEEVPKEAGTSKKSRKTSS
ncbi:hypothetical protein HA402_000514 [Bradysia odoriphaga]|nr:hypothetical protein HA402_000514 [Bradysia odoriphaga]